ncbi:hypothetical protein ACT3CE_00290 [Marinifilum sp. RC60d5]|uniref:hypothetical protein n=1 Tax=Marinifilum sp. RC60d5 TaxID=3458414 RepID=UPI0040362E0A
MKKVILILSIILLNIFQVSFNKVNANCLTPASTVGTYGIEDGLYTATIKYFNAETYKTSTYTLNVTVKYNSVTAIDFGNGGSVHTGYNNEGYVYYGGTLFFEKDYQGNIIAATTSVTISDGNGSRTFKIRIE